MYELFVERTDKRRLSIPDDRHLIHENHSFAPGTIFNFVTEIRVKGDSVLDKSVTFDQRPKLCLECGEPHANDTAIMRAVAIRLASDPAEVMESLLRYGLDERYYYDNLVDNVNGYNAVSGFTTVMGRKPMARCGQSMFDVKSFMKVVNEAEALSVYQANNDRDRSHWISRLLSVTLPLWGRHQEEPMLYDIEALAEQHGEVNHFMLAMLRELKSLFDKHRAAPSYELRNNIDFVARCMSFLNDALEDEAEHREAAREKVEEEEFDFTEIETDEHGQEIGGKQGKEVNITMVKYPLTQPYLGRIGSKSYRPSDAGLVPKHMNRWFGDKRVFARRRHVDGVDAAIMIDCSGSMSLDAGSLRNLMDSFPGSDIFGYVGNGGAIGQIARLAHDGRAVTDDLLDDWMDRGGGNDIDYEAIAYLFNIGRARTKIWVSDGAVCGGVHGDNTALAYKIRDFIVKNDDGRFFHFHDNLVVAETDMALHMKKVMYSAEKRHVDLRRLEFTLPRPRV